MIDLDKQIKEKKYAIEISQDELEARLYIAKDNDKEYSVSDIKEILKKEGIKNGIDMAAISKIVSDKCYEEEIVVAKGRASLNGKDGEFLFYFDRYPKTTPTILPDGSVDYRDICLFTYVEQGQLLVAYEKATKGVMGFTVTGRLLLPVPGKEKPPIRGDGFIYDAENNRYTASKSGKITYSEVEEMDDTSVNKYQFISINPVFVHQGTMYFREGDLSYEGDVLILGDVQTGIKIQATGDVQVEGTIECCEITAGGNVLIKKGILGAGKGWIQSGGYVKAKFFEAVCIKAKGEVQCNYLLNCDVSTEDEITVYGSKGSIVGGNAASLLAIKAFNIGNESEKQTCIWFGVNDQLNKQYKELTEKMDTVNQELEVFKNNASPENPLYGKILQAIYTTEEEMKQLVNEEYLLQEKIQKAQKAYILVRGYIYSGTVILSEGKKLTLRESLQSVRMIKKDDRIVVYHN